MQPPVGSTRDARVSGRVGASAAGGDVARAPSLVDSACGRARWPWRVVREGGQGGQPGSMVGNADRVARTLAAVPPCSTRPLPLGELSTASDGERSCAQA